MLTIFRARFRTMFPLAAVLICLLPAAVAAEEIAIVGTGDGIVLLESLGLAFNKIHSGTTITVPPSIGSSGGIKAVGADKHRLGRVARGIKDKEKSYGLTYVPFAKLAVAFFVNKSVKISGLSAEEILGIYSGKIKNWKDVGANEGKIRVVRREDGDSSMRVLRNTFPGFADIALTAKSKTTTTTQQTFTVISNTPGAIGFGPYPGAKQAGLNILSINGRHPTDPAYPSSTIIALIFKEKNRTGGIGEFIKFATSPAAFPAIRGADGVPY